MGTAAQGPSALIGQVIAGYQLERIVGTGATGAVFLGQPAGSAPGAAPAPTMATQVAIKILILPWQLDDGEREEFRARFLREANTLQRLRHPHILSVLAAGDDAGFTYMALPYMAGGTLAKRIASSPSLLPLTAAERYLSQLANALDYAHSEGIVHRDIKPANILLDEQEQVYLADFSIVRLLSETRTKLTTAGRVMGTPAYMAPEQVGTGTVGPATDIYSLGMVLYELTTGRVAFDATSLIDLIRQQVEAPPPPPRQARPDLPEPAAVAISKALAKRPQDRFASAGAFAWAFTAGLRGQWVEGLSPLVVEGSVGRGTTTVQQFTPQQTALSSPPYSSYPRPHQGTSRRAVVLGLLGLSAVGAGVMWFARSNLSDLSSSGQSNTARTPGGPGASVGSTLAIYRGHGDYVDTVAWSPDAARIASGAWDNTVQVWNASDGAPSRTYRGQSDHVVCAQWSPDGKVVASASDDHLVRIWDPDSGATLRTYRGHSDRVWSLAWSPDGQFIASTGTDRTIQIWNPSTLERIHILTGHSDFVRWIVWSPDGGRLATASYDHTARVWDIASESAIVTYAGHTDKCWALSWSPDGQRVASSGDTTVHIWDARSGNTSRVYRDHTDSTWAVAWSPKSSHVASSGADTTVRIWDADSGNTLFVYREHPLSVNYVAWSPDGERIGSGSDDRTVRVWRAN